MSVTFFESVCKEASRTDNLFGLCDDQHGTKAYSDTSDDRKWIATVNNDLSLEVTFTPIDHCIIVMKAGTKDKESTCDGMLTFRNSLYLVELKNQATGGWLPDAIEQLSNTIKRMNANQDMTLIKYKKAYACNKRHPNFTVLDGERRKKFFQETNGFRIDAQTEIAIK